MFYLESYISVYVHVLLINVVHRRVHVSEVTLSFLNNEFEVEPAHGERREEMLRQAGIKTYFIVRVLKPVSTFFI